MILSEKITELRKRSRLSQEEFGAEIGVSRQAVSKWEMGQTTPDLNKIMAMSHFFGVSTDFLLNDKYDLSFLDADNNTGITDAPIKKADMPEGAMVELKEIQEYCAEKKKAAWSFVTVIFLFFISPIAGIFISTFNEKYYVVGLLIQIIILIIAVVILIIAIWNLSRYRKLWHEDAELAYGVRSYIAERRKEFEHTFLVGIILGTVCILASVIPMMIVSGFTDTNDLAIAISGFIMLVIFAAGVSCITFVLTVNHGYKKVLKIS